MRISHKLKFIFFSIPRTASESIRSALDPYSDIKSEPKGLYHNHITALALRNHFNEMGWVWDDYFKFAFVRNPWDRFVGDNYGNN